ncbi:hypothetical protein SAMN05216174_10877 [Actinokineospora iranica]|uniref:Uncharacterized protein n=2 Tax=Actinokineospora iranica TaxID=1271860 RepID=A0A1G6SNU4_9PSEU|nr:hypothetical protein SAMN05216174_10877 [Actinokineospora iranica]
MEGPDGAGLHVRMAERDGRMVVTDLYLHADQVTPAMMRGVQLSTVEALFNMLRAEVGKLRKPESSPDVRDLHMLMGRQFYTQETDSFLDLKDSVPRTGIPPVSRPVMMRPDGKDPRAFYSQFAQVYIMAATESKRPSAVIAEESGVPVATVRRWVKEARARGFLPAGTKGKAG